MLQNLSTNTLACSGGRLSVCTPFHFATSLFLNPSHSPHMGFCGFFQVKCVCAHISPSMPRVFLAVLLFIPTLLFHPLLLFLPSTIINFQLIKWRNETVIQGCIKKKLKSIDSKAFYKRVSLPMAGDLQLDDP